MRIVLLLIAVAAASPLNVLQKLVQTGVPSAISRLVINAQASPTGQAAPSQPTDQPSATAPPTQSQTEQLTSLASPTASQSNSQPSQSATQQQTLSPLPSASPYPSASASTASATAALAAQTDTPQQQSQGPTSPIPGMPFPAFVAIVAVGSIVVTAALATLVYNKFIKREEDDLLATTTPHVAPARDETPKFASYPTVGRPGGPGAIVRSNDQPPEPLFLQPPVFQAIQQPVSPSNSSVSYAPPLQPQFQQPQFQQQFFPPPPPPGPYGFHQPPNPPYQ